MTPELTVAAGYANSLLEVAVARGADRAELLKRSGIEPAVLRDIDSRLPFAAFKALMREGKALSGDDALALHFGETTDMAQFSIVGLIADAALTMMDGMAQLNRYGQLVVEFEGPRDRFQAKRLANGELWGVDCRRKPNEFPELTESTFARMVVGPRRFGVNFVRALHVTHAEPAYAREYDRIFGVPVTFNSHWNAMLLDEAMMRHPVQRQPRYVFGILSEHADALLKKLQDSKTVRGRVEALLMPVLHKGEASMETIAAQMGTSRQTLYRSLKAEGVSFERVLDDLRHQLALHYLDGKKVAVHETAYLVGFSDPSAFSRAFKRWTGRSPARRGA